MLHKPKFKTSMKQCEYEGCEEVFEGVSSGCNPSKYCKEHKKFKYHKKTKMKKETKETISNNQNIKHSYKTATVIIGKCQLDGCGKDFEILVIPNIFVYPKYCPEHRNQFKRERFLQLNG
jgi:hypothetical protein